MEEAEAAAVHRIRIYLSVATRREEPHMDVESWFLSSLLVSNRWADHVPNRGARHPETDPTIRYGQSSTRYASTDRAARISLFVP